jgi:hypothetical protein
MEKERRYCIAYYYYDISATGIQGIVAGGENPPTGLANNPPVPAAHQEIGEKYNCTV